MLITSFPPLLVSKAVFNVRGLYEIPFPATPGLKSFGPLISTDVDVERLKTEIFNPNSKNAQTSSSVAPNETNDTLAVPELGFVILAENCAFAME
jgi:hypothetical protein